MDDLSAPSPRARRRPSRSFVLRAVAFLAVYGGAIIGLSAGVGVSERDLAGAGLGERAYYALGLFVLGGLDIGTPVGGSPAPRALLWAAYFAAPIITASAIVETVLRIFGAFGLRLRRLSNHVVIGGAGRLSLQYVRLLRERDPRRTIVVVERSGETPDLAELTRSHHAVVVQGDISNNRVLDEVRLSRAHRVLLFTNDDFANLDAAARIVRMAPRLRGQIVVHVSDLRFMKETAGSSVARDCEIFNGHEFAARHLVEHRLVERFRATPGRDPIVIAGFGRFGRTVLDQLQQRAPERFGPVVIVDHDATRNVRVFEEEPGFLGSYERLVVDGDVLDPDVWTRVRTVAGGSDAAPVFILGSGLDGTNLQAALSVRRQYPNAYIVVRGFRSSPFTDEVAEEAGLHAVNIGQLVRDGMPDRWF